MYLANRVVRRRASRSPRDHSTRGRSGRSASRGLRALSQALPALPRRLGGGRRADLAVPLSPPARLSQGPLQVHLDPPGPKPTRDDLRKTVRKGMHGTSMPAFEALISPAEIEQVIDYMIFLSMRGETELGLIDEAAIADENDPEAAPDGRGQRRRRRACSTSGRRPSRRSSTRRCRASPATRESVLRGRELFLGLYQDRNKLDCTACHGPQAMGNGRASSTRTCSTMSSSAGIPASRTPASRTIATSARRMDPVARRMGPSRSARLT